MLVPSAGRFVLAPRAEVAPPRRCAPLAPVTLVSLGDDDDRETPHTIKPTEPLCTRCKKVPPARIYVARAANVPPGTLNFCHRCRSTVQTQIRRRAEREAREAA